MTVTTQRVVIGYLSIGQGLDIELCIQLILSSKSSINRPAISGVWGEGAVSNNV